MDQQTDVTTKQKNDEIDKEAGLYDALRTVIDPEIGMNIIELGLVRGVEFDDERAHVNMIMTTPFCPYAPQLLEQDAPHHARLPRRPRDYRNGHGNVGPQHDGRGRSQRLGTLLGKSRQEIQPQRTQRAQRVGTAAPLRQGRCLRIHSLGSM